MAGETLKKKDFACGGEGGHPSGLPTKMPHKFNVYICYLACPSNLPLFDHRRNAWSKGHIMMLLSK